MLYNNNESIKEKINILCKFKFKADYNIVLYYHYKTIKAELLEDIDKDIKNSTIKKEVLK